MKLKIIIAVILFAILICSPTYADSLRCGNTLVSTGNSTSKVLLRCGKPVLTETVAVEKTKTSILKTEKSTAKEVMIEKWTYDFGKKYPLRILTFRNGVLVKIESEWR